METIEVQPVAALKTYKLQFTTDGDCASALCVTKQFLHMMLSGERPVSPRVLAKLGLRRAVVQVKSRTRSAS